MQHKQADAALLHIQFLPVPLQQIKTHTHIHETRHHSLIEIFFVQPRCPLPNSLPFCPFLFLYGSTVCYTPFPFFLLGFILSFQQWVLDLISRICTNV